MYFFDLLKYAQESVYMVKKLQLFGSSISDAETIKIVEKYLVYYIIEHINASRVLYLRKNNIVIYNGIDLSNEVSCMLDDVIDSTSFYREVMCKIEELFITQTWDLWKLEQQYFGYILTNGGDYRAYMFEKHCKNKLW